MQNWIRPASLGYLDGAVTTLAMLCFALGALPEQALMVGVAGWLAGAMSMGVNEYASVSDQNRAEGTSYTPAVAACSSFCAFSVGALVPLVPLVAGLGTVYGLVAGSIGLMIAGGVLGQFTNRPWFLSAVRHLGFGALACTLTLVVGVTIGVQV